MHFKLTPKNLSYTILYDEPCLSTSVFEYKQ